MTATICKSPPEKESARLPFTENEPVDIAPPRCETQAPESAHMALAKAWMRGDRTARFHFLADIRITARCFRYDIDQIERALARGGK